MMFLNHFILAFASVTYALHVPVDLNPCKLLPLTYPSLLTYRFLASNLSIPRGPAARRCDIGECINFALDVITMDFPAAIVLSIQQDISEVQTCLTDIENDKPLLNCFGACGQPGNNVLQTAQCGVTCVVQNGVPGSCVTMLGDVALAVIATTSPEAAILVMFIQAIECELQVSSCST
jgi:hypothetical protein